MIDDDLLHQAIEHATIRDVIRKAERLAQRERVERIDEYSRRKLSEKRAAWEIGLAESIVDLLKSLVETKRNRLLDEIDSLSLAEAEAALNERQR